MRRTLDMARRGGMGLLAGRAADELRAAGARPRRGALSGPDALTADEHRVATLAAGGYNNREIAERLYVTQRTVETHLTHVFQKALDLQPQSADRTHQRRHTNRPVALGVPAIAR